MDEMRFLTTPAFNAAQTASLVDWLSDLNDDLDGCGIPVNMEIWVETPYRYRRIVKLRSGEWEQIEDMDEVTVFLARSGDDKYAPSMAIKAAVILAVIAQLEIFGEQNILTHEQKTLARVRDRCYAILTACSAPYYVESADGRRAPVAEVGFERSRVYFKTGECWIGTNGEVLDHAPAYIVSVLEKER
jgi:hypothetical protein